ncbi:MAG: hypothetical protein MUE40_03635 [Anaerolineae bacterium]|nr:hypothetical protein [Anaerolineae bacterium]
MLKKLGLLLLLAGCGVRPPAPPPALPTALPVEAAATAFYLTENAPPPGREVVSFPQIDAGLAQQPGWRYEATLSFEGVFARTTRPITARTTLEVSFNQVTSARRVSASVDNDLQSDTPPTLFEAVRLAQDTFLVRDGGCITGSSPEMTAAADFSAGAILGGVQQARSAPRRAVINSQTVWRYDFTAPELLLPGITLSPESRLGEMTGELWVAAEKNIVIRYYVTLAVDNVRLFGGELPISGTLRLEYDLYDTGTAPNITVPFGC